MFELPDTRNGESGCEKTITFLITLMNKIANRPINVAAIFSFTLLTCNCLVLYKAKKNIAGRIVAYEIFESTDSPKRSPTIKNAGVCCLFKAISIIASALMNQ